MAKKISASIDLTKLHEWMQKNHTAFSRSSKNQHVYASLTVWVNDEPDQYGNHASIQLNSHKDGIEKDKVLTEGKNVYVGHGKIFDTTPAPLNTNGGEFGGWGGPPAAPQPAQNNPSNAWGPADDLPF